MDYVVFIISLIILLYGAELIISQSSKIALRFGISEYIVGATLIAFGTSLPEMAASISASYHNKAALAVSNIVGSNIINITLVLGSVLLLSKKITPKRDFFAKDSSWALFPVLIFLATISEGGKIQEITQIDGIAFLFLMLGYILFLIRNNEETLQITEDEIEKNEFHPIKVTMFLIGGFLGVVYGADYLVKSASNIARSFGVSEWVIGVFLIAFGTSLPELVVSIMAGIKNRADMAIGNIIGSNMANISVALGAAAITRPIKLNFFQYSFDIAIMVMATFMLVFITANKMYTKAAGISLFVLLTIFLEHLIKQA